MLHQLRHSLDHITIRIFLGIILGILLALFLVLGTQWHSAGRDIKVLKPEVKQTITSLIVDDLSESERLELWQTIFDNPENIQQLDTFVQQRSKSGERALLFAIFLVLLIGLGIAFSMDALVRMPIASVSKASRQVNSGDLTARAPLSKSFLTYREIRQLVSDFNSMAESLESMHDNQKQIIADIAHELCTPLAILQGQIDAMTYDVVPLNTDEIGKLSRQTELLARLVKDLRVLSLAETGQLTLERSKTDIGDLLSDIALDFEVQARERNIIIDLDIPPTPLMVSIDLNRMFQVLMNIISNALRYTPKGGTITLAAHDFNNWSTHSKGSKKRNKLKESYKYVNISIHDSGKGLTEEGIARVFTRFYREDRARSRDSGGSGLGLPIAKSIVELHGGKISASNHPAGGALFIIELPYTEQD